MHDNEKHCCASVGICACCVCACVFMGSMTDDMCEPLFGSLCMHVCVCACMRLDIFSVYWCVYECGLILTKPVDVCLTLIQSQRLIGISAPRICLCMCTVRVHLYVSVYFCYGLAGGKLSSLKAMRVQVQQKVTLLNLSGKGRGGK